MKWSTIILCVYGIAWMSSRFVAAQDTPPPSEDDRYWDDRFFAPYPPPIGKIVFGSDGVLYAASNFQQIGGVLANTIAAWDGSWFALPGVDDLPGRVGYRNLLMIGRDGHLYGNVGNVSDYPAYSRGIARWDGNIWSITNSSPEWLAAMAVDENGLLYAGGGFNSPDGNRYGSGVWRWDGTKWTGMGGSLLGVKGLAIGPSNELYALATSAQDTGPCVWVECVWRWSSAGEWERLGDTGFLGIGRFVVDALGNVFVGGWQRVVMWDGNQWLRIKTTIGYAAPVLDRLDRLYVVERESSGSTRIERWDRQTWEVVNAELVGSYTLAFDPENVLFAAGTFSGPNDIVNISRLRDGEWEDIVPRGFGADDAIYLVGIGADGSVIVRGGITGHLSRVGALQVGKEETVGWDGTQWVHTPEIPKGVRRAVLDPDGNLYVAGRFEVDGDLFYLARRVGDRWVGLVDELGGAELGGVLTIDRLAIASTGELSVSGYFTSIMGVEANGIAGWNGDEWRALGAGLSKGPYLGRAFAMEFGSDGNLYVGGDFVVAGDEVANSVAVWDGETWRALDAGVQSSLFQTGNGVVSDIALVGGLLYVGGTFDRAGAVSTSNIASWDGQEWSGLGLGTDASVGELLAGADGDLYVGGQFSWASEVRADRIARWTGSTWESLGSGVSAQNVGWMAFDTAGALLIGGYEIVRSGDKAAFNVARWLKSTGIVIEPPVVPLRSLSVEAVYPNPSVSTARLTVVVAEEQRVHVSVFDLLGREITVLKDGLLSRGEHEFVVDTIGWPAGVYIVSAVGESGRAERSVVHVR